MNELEKSIGKLDTTVMQIIRERDAEIERLLRRAHNAESTICEQYAEIERLQAECDKLKQAAQAWSKRCVEHGAEIDRLQADNKALRQENSTLRNRAAPGQKEAEDV